MAILELQSEADYRALLERSADRPVLLFKHSTRCPLSASAHREFEAFAGTADGVDCARVLVIERRSLSGFIAEVSGVRHESPQAILFNGGRAVWSASHQAITRDALAAVCGSRGESVDG